MADQPAFLTTREVADLLRVKERKVYDMAAEGEIPCRRVTGKLLFPRSELEAWLGGSPASTAPDVIAGSHDPLLDWAIRASGSGLASFYDGSLDGLDRIATGQAIAAGMHLFEPATGTWNTDHASARLAGAPVVLIGWARRQQGLILSPALTERIDSVADLRGKRIAMRQPAAGAGLLFAHLMAEAGLSENDIDPLPDLARTETEAATAVASGQADAAPGLAAAALPLGLGFVATMQEHFDLAIDRRAYFEAPVQSLLAFARTPAFEAKARELTGYDLGPLGSVRWNAP